MPFSEGEQAHEEPTHQTVMVEVGDAAMVELEAGA